MSYVYQYSSLQVNIEGNLNYFKFSCLGHSQDDRVLLGDVKVLTLYKGRMTQARRVSPIPHIKCIGGTANCDHEPDLIHCYNRGSDGVDNSSMNNFFNEY